MSNANLATKEAFGFISNNESVKQSFSKLSNLNIDELCTETETRALIKEFETKVFNSFNSNMNELVTYFNAKSQ